MGPAADGRIAILGFGHQGEAQALNLRDGGRSVVVGARPGHPAEERARALGFEVRGLAEAAHLGEWVAALLPDDVLPSLWPTIVSALTPDATVVFAHGFNLLYGGLDAPTGRAIVLVSPTAPGHVLRERVVAGETVPAYVAIHAHGGGGAWERAETYAKGIGCGPLWRASVGEETEVDLFGEQVVLCGGMNTLVTAAFEVLVERGYPPEMAYLECVHQLKYLADLLHERGVAGMRRGISSTALYGDLTRGPRVIGEPARAAMREILEEIRSGAFAREWKAEVAAGAPRTRAAVEASAAHPIESARARALSGGTGSGT
jgi:ketol-acid reductoisomerase